MMPLKCFFKSCPRRYRSGIQKEIESSPHTLSIYRDSLVSAVSINAVPVLVPFPNLGHFFP
jgi:hypothetical protein